MLTHMRLTFRTFDNEEIRFAPLTILIGPNGAGKSTILHALALLAQSWISTEQSPLALNGPWIKLGEFENLAPKGYVDFFLEWNWLGQKQGIEFVVQKQEGNLQVCRDRFRYYCGTGVYSLPSQVEPLRFSFAPREGTVPFTEELRALLSVNGGLSALLLRTHYLSARLQPVCAVDGFYSLPVDSIGPDARDLVSFLVYQPEAVLQINQFLAERNVAPIEIRLLGDRRYVIYRRCPDTNVSIELANDGSGYLDLISILAELLGTPEGHLILLEQPEAHLHSQLALHIADATISAVRQGKYVLLDTHSEEIVLRLRRRIAEGAISPDQAVVYFVRRAGMKSLPIRIEFDSMGQPNPGWPDDFWGEDYEEAFHLARAMARKTREQRLGEQKDREENEEM